MLGQSPLAAVKGAPLPLFMESWVNLKAAINIPLSACAIAQSVGIQLGNERSPEPVSRVLISISCQSSNSAWLKNKQFHQQTLNLKHSGGDDAKTAVRWAWLGAQAPWVPLQLCRWFPFPVALREHVSSYCDSVFPNYGCVTEFFFFSPVPWLWANLPGLFEGPLRSSSKLQGKT